MPGKVISPSASPSTRRCASAAGSTVDHRLAVALVARLQAGDLPRQPRAHASPRALQPRPAARADARAAARLRARRRLSGAAALAAATWRWPSRACALLTELGVAPQLLDAAGCRAVEPGLNPETAAARRHLPAGRRGRQLPPVRPPAAQGGGARRRPVPLRHPGRADRRRRAAAAWSSRARRAIRATRPCGLARRRSGWSDDRSPRPSEPASRASTRSSSARRSTRGALLRPLGVRLPLLPVLRLLGDGAAAPRRPASAPGARARR